MTQFSDTYQAVDEEYRAQAALPVPEAAVVLDTRQRDDDPIPLLAHLNTELADLAVEMRSHNVTHWSHLRDCIALLRLDAISSEFPLQQDTVFLLTSPGGMEQAYPGAELLTGALSNDFVEQVRTARLNAPGGVKQSTVRVFLLADMREAESLARAATYAHWLKAWSEQEHGRSRHHRDERIHTVILCLNAGVSYQDVLLEALGQAPESAVDTIILLQKYSDDDAAIGEAAQLARAELLLYTLILRWPDVLWKRIDDPIEMHPRFIEAATTLPWPTYLIGLAAFEYSSRWSARWLDYSVTGAILKTLNSAGAIEQERPLLATTVHKWLDAWQHDLQAVVPGMLTTDIDELQGLSSLGDSTRFAALSRGKLLTAPGKLDALRTNVNALYTGMDAPTIQLAIENGPLAVLDQLRRHTERSERADLFLSLPAGDSHDELVEPYRRLVVLQQKLERFLGLHFKDAEGAVPRGLVQLAAFQARAQQTIAATAQKQLKLREYEQQFEQAAQTASVEMGSKFKTWRLPFAGKLFRSTVISWNVATVIGVLLISAVNWGALLVNLLPSLALSLQLPTVTRIAQALIILLVLAGEWLYLARRNRSLRRLCRDIEKRLDGIITRHLAAAGEVIAARVGLALVKQAGLYAVDEASSPYEGRLQTFAQACRRAQGRTDLQQSLAETRLGIDLNENVPSPAWDGPPHRYAHPEFIDWSRIEEAFLETCRALPSSPMLNLLVEMLLRQFGTERPQAMLDDIWQQQRWIKGKDKEARFQTIGALLVALLLAAPVNQPSWAYQAELLSALLEYTALKKLYVEERAMPAGDAIELQTAFKSTMMARALGSQRALSTKQSEQQGIAALITWVNDQHGRIPQLREIFATGDLLEHLMLSHMQPSLILDALYDKGTLLGYPDEISGEDTYYLFAAQGNEFAYSVLVEAIDKVDGRRVQVMAFPDREKLIYLRIHRALQFFSQDDGAAEKG